MGFSKYVRESMAELEHVAWPTPAETKRYFGVTVAIMAAMVAILFAAISLFSGLLWGAKDAVNPVMPSSLSNSELPASFSGLSFSGESAAKSATGAVSSEASAK